MANVEKHPLLVFSPDDLKFRKIPKQIKDSLKTYSLVDDYDHELNTDWIYISDLYLGNNHVFIAGPDLTDRIAVVAEYEGTKKDPSDYWEMSIYSSVGSEENRLSTGRFCESFRIWFKENNGRISEIGHSAFWISDNYQSGGIINPYSELQEKDAAGQKVLTFPCLLVGCSIPPGRRVINFDFPVVINPINVIDNF